MVLVLVIERRTQIALVAVGVLVLLALGAVSSWARVGWWFPRPGGQSPSHVLVGSWVVELYVGGHLSTDADGRPKEGAPTLVVRSSGQWSADNTCRRSSGWVNAQFDGTVKFSAVDAGARTACMPFDFETVSIDPVSVSSVDGAVEVTSDGVPIARLVKAA